jgi:hypothetical protein
MFICENCNLLVERGQPVNRIVISYRSVVYNNIVRTRKQEKRLGLSKGDTFSTTGKEIEKEIVVCPKCCIALTGQIPKLKQKTDSPRRHPRRRKPRKDYKRVEQKRTRHKPDVKVVNKLPIIK